MAERKKRETGRVMNDPLDWIDTRQQEHTDKPPAPIKTTVVKKTPLTQPIIQHEQEIIMAESQHTLDTHLLEHVSTCIQIADENNIITYMNPSVMEMFANAEEGIRKYLPHFDKNKLIGSSMDVFHKNPAHQRDMIAHLTQPFKTRIKLGEWVFELTATPLFDTQAKRTGTMVEWTDVSVMEHISEVLAEVAHGKLDKVLIPKEFCKGAAANLHESTRVMRENIRRMIGDIDAVALATQQGDLSIRVDVSQHQGEFAKIVSAMNGALDSVISPIYDIMHIIEALGENDLSLTMEGDYQGEFLRIKDTFENALISINTAMHQIVGTVEQVGDSADHLNAASQNMASTAEEQSSSVEEVTSSLEETDSQVKANTDNANAANQLVIDTSQAANQGQIKMGGMIEAMGAINESSQNIAKIIKVIDEIAFQTNLLALNAAVEAARAGQHGRGFAVVAQEVRNLAGRSAKAARETAELIENSSKRVIEGVEIANETRVALDQIVGNVIKVKDLVAEIATASVEQSTGVSQINVAMNQVAKAAQESSQQAEELATASNELNRVANIMRSEIRNFKLRERPKQANDLANMGLEGLTPELLMQIKALLANPQLLGLTTAKTHAVSLAPSTIKKTAPKAILPLDADERGFGEF